MIRKCLAIGISITAVIILILTPFCNVVGYQTVQSSNQKIVNDEVNQKELLFQTIVNMANNKEIQRVILGSELVGKRPYDSTMRFSAFAYPVLTKKFLNFAFLIVLLTFRPYSVVASIFLAFLEPLFYIEATLKCYWYK